MENSQKNLKPKGKANNMEKKAVITKNAVTQKGTHEQRMIQAEMLLDVSRKVAAIDSLDEVLSVLMEMSTYELGAERSSLFLNDPQSGELYSRFAQGNFQREIRIINDLSLIHISEPTRPY